METKLKEALQELIPDQKVVLGSTLAVDLRNRGIPIVSLRKEIQPFLDELEIEEVVNHAAGTCYRRKESMVQVLQRLIPDRKWVYASDLGIALRGQGIKITSLRSDIAPYLEEAGIEEIRKGPSAVFYRRKPSIVEVLRLLIPDYNRVYATDLAEKLREQGVTVVSLRKDLEPYLEEAGIEEILEGRTSLFYRRKIPRKNSNGITSSYGGSTSEAPVPSVITPPSTKSSSIDSRILMIALRKFIPDRNIVLGSKLAVDLRRQGIPITILRRDISPYLEEVGIEEVHGPAGWCYRRKNESTDNTGNGELPSKMIKTKENIMMELRNGSSASVSPSVDSDEAFSFSYLKSVAKTYGGTIPGVWFMDPVNMDKVMEEIRPFMEEKEDEEGKKEEGKN